MNLMNAGGRPIEILLVEDSPDDANVTMRGPSRTAG